MDHCFGFDWSERFITGGVAERRSVQWTISWRTGTVWTTIAALTKKRSRTKSREPYVNGGLFQKESSRRKRSIRLTESLQPIYPIYTWTWCSPFARTPIAIHSYVRLRCRHTTCYNLFRPVKLKTMVRYGLHCKRFVVIASQLVKLRRNSGNFSIAYDALRMRRRPSAFCSFLFFFIFY